MKKKTTLQMTKENKWSEKRQTVEVHLFGRMQSAHSCGQAIEGLAKRQEIDQSKIYVM